MTRIETDGSKANTREGRLLAVLMEHTCKNALEVARDSEYWWDYYDREDEHWQGSAEATQQAFIEAIDRCFEGMGTDADWDWLVAETQM